MDMESSPGNDSDIENFTKNILERAKQRLKVLDPNAHAGSSVGIKTTDNAEPASAPPVAENTNILQDVTEEVVQKTKVVTFDLENLDSTSDDDDDSIEDEGEEQPLQNTSTAPERQKLTSTTSVKTSLLESFSATTSYFDSTAQTNESPQLQTSRVTARTSRLTALANTINNWEDDLTHHCLPTSRFNITKSPPKSQTRLSTMKQPTLTPTTSSSPAPPKADDTVDIKVSTESSAASAPVPAPPKVVETTDAKESKGSLSASSLSAPAKDEATAVKLSTLSPVKEKPMVKSPIKSNFQMNLERLRKVEHNKPTVEPVMTAPARQEIVEESASSKSNAQETGCAYIRGRPSCVIRKGTVQNQRRLFESGPPTPVRGQYAIPKGTVKTQKSLFEGTTASRNNKSPPKDDSPRARSLSPVRKQLLQQDKNIPKYVFGGGLATIADKSEESSQSSAKDKQEQCTFAKVAEQSPAPPPPTLPLHNFNPSPRSRSLSPKRRPKSSGTSGKRCGSPTQTSSKSKYPGLTEIKKIRVSEPKEGKIYPSLTDIECTTTENEETEDEGAAYEDEDMDLSTESFTKPDTKAEALAKLTTPRTTRYRPTEEFNNSLAIQQIGQMLDDALEGQDCDYTLDTVVESQLEAQASSTPNTQSLSNTNSPTTLSNTWLVSDQIRKLSQRSDNTINNYDGTTLGQAPGNTELPKPSLVLETDLDALDSPNERKVQCDLDGPKNHDDEPKQDSEPVSTSSPLTYRHEEPEPSPIHHTPLLHTVSFYRKQQTPLKIVDNSSKPVQELQQPSSQSKDATDMKEIRDKIKKLEDEVSAQQRSISQVSKALNLCKATLEFSDSTENVECERVLLLATPRIQSFHSNLSAQKRMAVLNEIQKLKTDAVLQKPISDYNSSPSCRGNMTLSNLTLPIKRDFITTKLNGQNVYHFLCLVKYREQVESSELISISTGQKLMNEIKFNSVLKIADLQPEFQVQVEIYGLQTMKEFLPHEAKYHIKKEKTKTTPRKRFQLTGVSSSPASNALSRPFQSSPAGPDAVRTSNFILYGLLRIDISTLQRTRWFLEERTVSPLEGSISFDIKCSAESGVDHRGYLTLFNDVAGFGAWERRWVSLIQGRLDYWMYHDDDAEGRLPLGSIQLNTCITGIVGPVSREICARANTFLLVTTRNPEETDKNSLTMSCHLDHTAIKHLISADTKEERDIWCKQINRVLSNVRAWDPNARKVEYSK